ncbi:hypothetical protein [Kitasatospora sp. A2-31]|uniref:hypothetical protein n=1 Tax=Kitasatospora sp. A2-31 TaxID=2916414 RepID=UPI001EEE67B0|nr:hypothetical protein [Kitasatospora sp. A2-31]MCG6499427.1 hypothetical protein [Kitasatospora sp. A2-31]
MTAHQVPAWLADRNPTSDRARVEQCRTCQQPVIRALVGRIGAIDIRVDPAPVGHVEEIAARLAGRWTYCLQIRPHLPARLLDRHQWHIAGGRCTHLVLAQHDCPGRRPAGPIQEALL